jgi:ribosomal protein L16 Arg81 hydroxylase
MKNTQALIKQFTSELFIRRYFMKRPGVFDFGKYFLKTAKIPGSDQVIRKHAKDFPSSMNFYYKGRSVYMFADFSKEKAKERYHSALSFLRQSHPILLSQFAEWNQFYGEVLKGLGEFYKAETQSMIIYSPQGAQGAKKHIDRSHIFVFQHEGRCRWIVHNREKKKLVLDVILRPGQVLHVPQGFYHQVERRSIFHTHVTLGLRYKTPRAEMKMLYAHPMLAPAIPEYHQKLTKSELKALIASYPNQPLLPDN